MLEQFITALKAEIEEIISGETDFTTEEKEQLKEKLRNLEQRTISVYGFIQDISSNYPAIYQDLSLGLLVSGTEADFALLNKFFYMIDALHILNDILDPAFLYKVDEVIFRAVRQNVTLETNLPILRNLFLEHFEMAQKATAEARSPVFSLINIIESCNDNHAKSILYGILEQVIKKYHEIEEDFDEYHRYKEIANNPDGFLTVFLKSILSTKAITGEQKENVIASSDWLKNFITNNFEVFKKFLQKKPLKENKIKTNATYSRIEGTPKPYFANWLKTYSNVGKEPPKKAPVPTRKAPPKAAVTVKEFSLEEVPYINETAKTISNKTNENFVHRKLMLDEELFEIPRTVVEEDPFAAESYNTLYDEGCSSSDPIPQRNMRPEQSALLANSMFNTRVGTPSSTKRSREEFEAENPLDSNDDELLDVSFAQLSKPGPQPILNYVQRAAKRQRIDADNTEASSSTDAQSLHSDENVQQPLADEEKFAILTQALQRPGSILGYGIFHRTIDGEKMAGNIVPEDLHKKSSGAPSVPVNPEFAPPQLPPFHRR